ncbi:TPA: hypothetical protein UZ441_004479 [Escherichia coli]|nr:hypothetical protein [Escherichia coli]HEL8025676.1 hypothetical protein [Escherichia coli]HEL8044409.1 hypothetical protein [Escherichia coli]HEL8049221.1 hypothetical protein [Escherichia coli]HEL8054013.1 hypothetical protein [Escherichia coli]
MIVKYSIFTFCICVSAMSMCVSAAENSVGTEVVKSEPKEEPTDQRQDIISSEDKADLEAFKKLQMDNIRLKLQSENNKLSQELGLSSADIKLIRIYKAPDGRKVAEVLGGGFGFRTVSAGESLSAGEHIKEIGNDYITSVTDDGKEKTIRLLSLGYGG